MTIVLSSLHLQGRLKQHAASALPNVPVWAYISVCQTTRRISQVLNTVASPEGADRRITGVIPLIAATWRRSGQTAEIISKHMIGKGMSKAGPWALCPSHPSSSHAEDLNGDRERVINPSKSLTAHCAETALNAGSVGRTG